MWKQLFELLQGALFLGRDVVQLRREVEQLRKEMNDCRRESRQRVNPEAQMGGISVSSMF